MQQNVKVEPLVALVLHLERRLQSLRRENHAVQKPKVVRPGGADLFLEHLQRKTKVKLHSRPAVGLGRGFAEERPGRGSGKAMLREFRGCVVRGRGTKDLAQSALFFLGVRCAERTGNTTGIPPRIALLPSSTAWELTNSCSSPSASFHDVTVAPYRRTDTDSPVGRRASICLSETSTVG